MNWNIYTADLGWERRPIFNGWVAGGKTRREFDFQGFFSDDTQQIADKSRRKIIIIGDSTTFGYNVSTTLTFAELLDKSIPDVDVINIGVIGYSSYQVYKALVKHGIKINPSLIIMSSNYNDRRVVLKKTDVDSESKFKKIKKEHTHQILDQIYLCRLIMFIFKKLGINQDISNLENININNLHSRVSPENYQRNLIKIAELAHKKKIHLIFMLLKDNPVLTENLKIGIMHIRESNYELAINNLTLALKSKYADNHILARKYLAEVYSKIENEEKEKEIKILNKPFLSLFGGHPLYLDREYNEIMISVAKKYNIKIVDAGHVLDQNPAAYHDFCHPNEYGHQKIAQRLDEVVLEILFNNSSTN